MVFVTLDGAPVSLSQAKKLERVSVQQNTPFETFLQSNGFDNLARLTDPAPQHIYLLKVNRSQAWFTAKDLAYYALREQLSSERFVFSKPMYISDVYVATSKELPAPITSAYNKVFDEMLIDGSYEAIMQRYRRD